MKFPFIRQHDEMDCGAICLQMIAQYHGKELAIQDIRERCFTNESGTSIYNISEAAESYGFNTGAFQTDVLTLAKEAITPFIAHWNNDHFVVVHKITKNHFYVADPAIGLIKYDYAEFSLGFCGDEEDGILLQLEKGDSFQSSITVDNNETEGPWKHLARHIRDMGLFNVQILISTLFIGIISLLLPLMSQALVDDGVTNNDLGFVKVILFAQLFLFVGKFSFDALKNWIIIHWSYRLNIKVISEFLRKFLGLSGARLSDKSPGDILQRVEDYQHVQDFLSNSSINVILSGITIILFSVLMIFYNVYLLLIFLIGTIISIFWIWIFQAKRRNVYYKLIGLMTENKATIIDIIEGINEIKQYGLETSKRWQWENVHIKEYDMSLKNLQIDQTQIVGFQAITELKNLAILFVGVLLVMNGELSLGGLLAITFIAGQLNNSLSFIPQLFHMGQEAKISMERILAISNEKDDITSSIGNIDHGDIVLSDVDFTYDGITPTLQNLNLTIKKGQTTAIVGASGSGKTTLFKLLTKFITPQNGTITVDGVSLPDIHDNAWRKNQSVVFQDGHIFPDTLANNVAVGKMSPNMKRVMLCCKTARPDEFLNRPPNRYQTRLGRKGVELSKGQKQRILIARALYRNPHYIFMDEATSALDTINEKAIKIGLDKVLKGKTVLIIAHRLSTVKNADKIVVLDKGEIVEEGTHDELVSNKSHYFQLVKEQLNLGS